VDSQTVLGLYEQVLALTRDMLDAARRSDWDALVQRERERAQLVDRIREHDPDPARDPAGRERKRAIILEIVQGDEQIQVLTQDWMHELREVLGSLSTEQRLSRTYGP
jgi:flagellar protein FliT